MPPSIITELSPLNPASVVANLSIRGLRITAYDTFGWLASGMSENEVIDDFPGLTKQDIRAALTFAADQHGRLMRLFA